MQTLPVNDTCSSGVGGQQPDHNGDLQLIVQWKPRYTEGENPNNYCIKERQHFHWITESAARSKTIPIQT